MKVDFGKMVFVNRQGKVMDLPKSPYMMMADLLWQSAMGDRNGREMVRLSESMMDEKPVIELSEKQIKTIANVFLHLPSAFAWVQIRVIEFLEKETGLKLMKEEAED